MNYFNQFINDLLTEVSYRTEEGIVDLKKSEHLTILSEVLDELGLWEIKSELFQNLFEDGDQTLDPDQKEKAKQMGLVWKGQGWGKEDEEGIQYKVQKGKLVPFERGDGGDADTPKSNIFSKDSGYQAPDLDREKDIESEETTNVSEEDKKVVGNNNPTLFFKTDKTYNKMFSLSEGVASKPIGVS